MSLPVKAVIFDWAGTLIDYGSKAPVLAFVQAFSQFGLNVTESEARAPMGLPKRKHIEAMLKTKSISTRWCALHGALTEADIDAIYETYLPLNEKLVVKYADLIPGALETLRWLRAHDIKIATTTGYSRSIMEKVLPRVRAQGFEPEIVVCADDVQIGRPGPLCIYKCMVDLGVYPVGAVIKVDDTPSGLGEGVSAGCINVGISLSGNCVGKSLAQLASLDPSSVNLLTSSADKELRTAGADHVIETVADLPALIEQLPCPC